MRILKVTFLFRQWPDLNLDDFKERYYSFKLPHQYIMTDVANGIVTIHLPETTDRVISRSIECLRSRLPSCEISEMLCDHGRSPHQKSSYLRYSC